MRLPSLRRRLGEASFNVSPLAAIISSDTTRNTTQTPGCSPLEIARLASLCGTCLGVSHALFSVGLHGLSAHWLSLLMGSPSPLQVATSQGFGTCPQVTRCCSSSKPAPAFLSPSSLTQQDDDSYAADYQVREQQ